MEEEEEIDQSPSESEEDSGNGKEPVNVIISSERYEEKGEEFD